MNPSCDLPDAMACAPRTAAPGVPHSGRDVHRSAEDGSTQAYRRSRLGWFLDGTRWHLPRIYEPSVGGCTRLQIGRLVERCQTDASPPQPPAQHAPRARCGVVTVSTSVSNAQSARRGLVPRSCLFSSMRLWEREDRYPVLSVLLYTEKRDDASATRLRERAHVCSLPKTGRLHWDRAATRD